MRLNQCRYHRFLKILPILGMALSLATVSPALAGEEEWTGERIMREALRRHEGFSYVFEEQSMVLQDGAGNRDIRKLRRFSRAEKDGTTKLLLAFDAPEEVRGVALLDIRSRSGGREGGIYLPAFGKELKSLSREERGHPFLGTDLSIEDLTPEVLSDFRYVRGVDHMVQKTPYFVVDVYPASESGEGAPGFCLRRHFIRQDIFFIIRTDYFDRHGRFIKRLTRHDPKHESGDAWRADMILMENFRERHSTLIKTHRRVLSHDYVPAEIFEVARLFENRHMLKTEDLLFRSPSVFPGESGTGPAQTRPEKKMPEGPTKEGK